MKSPLSPSEIAAIRHYRDEGKLWLKNSCWSSPDGDQI
jgi:hypothetical protein